MKAVLVARLSPDLSGVALTELAEPERRPGELLVAVEAASLNFPDLLMTKGEYQHKPPLPFVPGMEMAGTVLEADADSPHRPGDLVVAGTRTGGFAERAIVSAATARAVPEGMSAAAAASVGAAYLTAYVALVRLGQMEAGQWVLVNGASGGVGLAAVDLAGAMGARVIATSRSADKLRVIADEYEPDATIVVEGDWREQVKALTDGRGVDLAYDPVGGDVFDETARCMAFGGKLLVIGFTAGRIPTIGVNYPLIKGFSIVGVRAGEYGRRFPERGRENQAAVWALAAEGRIRPRVHAAYALEDWRAAFDAMAAGEIIGKVVLCPKRRTREAGEAAWQDTTTSS